MAERKRVIVSGASSGIGRATAERFGREGWHVCVTARRVAELRRVVAEFPPGEHLVCPGDYSDPATAAAIGEQVSKRWGGVDVLVNCAGVSFAGHTIDAPLADFRRSLDIMLDGAIYLTRMAVPLMTGGGRVIHVTSIHGERAEALSSGYAMAKAAINQYCRGLALELARNILVNAIAPGFVRTAMSVVNGVSELETSGSGRTMWRASTCRCAGPRSRRKLRA